MKKALLITAALALLSAPALAQSGGGSMGGPMGGTAGNGMARASGEKDSGMMPMRSGNRGMMKSKRMSSKKMMHSKKMKRSHNSSM